MCKTKNHVKSKCALSRSLLGSVFTAVLLRAWFPEREAIHLVFGVLCPLWQSKTEFNPGCMHNL